jgi:hypothetical protein
MDINQLDDIEYFLKKATLCFQNKDMKGVEQCVRRLYLMFDALIVYRLHKGNS